MILRYGEYQSPAGAFFAYIQSPGLNILRSANRLRMVRDTGIEPVTPTMSM